ncbi:hypothetical protein LXL04_034373 [Taraxacum kok-saghyz]
MNHSLKIIMPLMPIVGLLVFLVLKSRGLLANGDPHPHVPCYFIFGDSLMDNGNNNNLPTQAKVNFPPYGIDFPDGPTGRFSNGRNIADVIAQLLGFKNFIPPFATAKDEEIINGVNYASGGAGIRDETGQHMGSLISFSKQIINHNITISQLSSLIANGSLALTRKYLNRCIYTIDMGNNDYINNYFVPKYYQTSRDYTPAQYAKVLVEQYSRQLQEIKVKVTLNEVDGKDTYVDKDGLEVVFIFSTKKTKTLEKFNAQELYKNGARKFGIFAAGNSGCCPGIMADHGLNTCVESVNNAVKLFNNHLNNTLYDLNNRFLNAKFILIDDPLVYPNDLNVTDKPCCEVALSTTGKGSCVPNQVPCNNRQNYYFWDAYHPTERVSIIVGTKAYETLSPFYNPNDFSPIKPKKLDYSDA